MKIVIALFAILGMTLPAAAFQLHDGVYQGKLFGDCGQFTISGGGTKISYKSGESCDAATFRSGASFDGSVIKVKAARLSVSSSSSKSISGTWKLRGKTAKVSFGKVR